MTEHHHHHARDYSALYVPGAIIIAGVIIGIFALLGLRSLGNAALANGAATGQQPSVAVDIKDVKTAGEPYIGDANAKVVLAFWSDFQCPYCKAVEVGGVPQIPTAPAIPDIIKNYVDTGKVKIVFKDYPFLGNDSITDAEYGRSVWKLYPTKYFAFRTAMYQAQDEEGDQGFGNEATVVTLLATIPGIDAQKVKADVAANKAAYDAAADADKTEGSNFGISGTPGFITGKTLIPGAVDYAQFKQAIDAQL